MLADDLDGLANVDATTVDLDVLLLLDGIGDHLRSDGTEQDAFVANLGLDGEGCTLELGLQALSVGNANLFALGDVLTTELELLEVALSRLHGNALLEKVVVGETAGNFDDVAFAALAPQLFEKNNFHCGPLSLVAPATVTAAADCGNRVGHEGHRASALHGVRDVALMLHAGASDTTRLDFAAISHELAQNLRVLVVDVVHLVLAELAVLTTRLFRIIGHLLPLSILERDIVVVH